MSQQTTEVKRKLDWKRFLVSVSLVGLMIILLAACGGPPTQSMTGSFDSSRTVTVRVAPATTGDIVLITPYAAIVGPVDQIDLAPLERGRLDSLAVGVGSEVKKGQLLGELSHGTLDAELAEAEAALRISQAKLAKIKAAARPAELKGQAKLHEARAKLDELVNPLESDLRVAESAVNAAESKLDSARTKLDQLIDPSGSDVQKAESDVVAQQSNLDTAKTNLAELLDPSDKDLQIAQSEVAAAQSVLDSAKTKLDDVLNPSAAVVAAAQEAVAKAHSELSTAQTRVNRTIDTELQNATIGPPWPTLREARIAQQGNMAAILNPVLSAALTPTQITNAREIADTTQVAAASLLAQATSDAAIPEDLRAALWEEQKAQSTLDTALERLQELLVPLDNNIALAEDEVAKAQASLDSAVAKLKELQAPTANTIALRQNQVAVAQAALDSAMADLAELEAPEEKSIAQAQYDVDAAQAQLDVAAAKLAHLQNPTPADLAAATSAVVDAEQNLALNIVLGVGFLDPVAAQAQVDEDQAKVEFVKQQLAELQVIAPFDAYVTRSWLSLGAMASSQMPIVTLESKEVVISLRIEETGIGSLHQGQEVAFTTPAVPGRVFPVLVDWIAPSADGKAHTFSAQLRPMDQSRVLKPGMSGKVSISNRHDNVTLVPKEAVIHQGIQAALFVVEDGNAYMRQVAEDLIDDNNVEISNGVQPGDLVVIAGQNLLNDGDPVIIDDGTETALGDPDLPTGN